MCPANAYFTKIELMNQESQEIFFYRSVTWRKSGYEKVLGHSAFLW